MAIKCKELRSLDVSYLQITNKCIASITQLSYLETFISVGCVCVDDKGLTLLKNGCKSLQRLDVSKCQSMSSTGIISLASGCIALRQLSLAYCVPVRFEVYWEKLQVSEGIELKQVYWGDR